jgi:hypothetical protein
VTDIAVAVAAGVVALSFGWAALGKLIHPDRWRADLSRYHLSRPLRAVGLLVLPWIEILVVVLVLLTSLITAAAVALPLLAAFSLAMVRLRMLQQANKVPCGCFGGSGARDYRLLLGRNAVLIALSLAVLVSGREAPLLPTSSSGRVPVPLLFGILGVVAALWIARQTSVYLERQRGR